VRPKNETSYVSRTDQHVPKYDDFGRQQGIEHLGTALGGH
jgi:hypothetical protein